MSKRPYISSRTLTALALLPIVTPYILAVCIATDLGSPAMRLLYLICGLMWILLPALFLKKKAFFAFHSITVLLGMVECVHLIMYQATTSLLFVNTILIAEPGEFLELCSTGWPVIVLAVAFFAGYFRLIKKLDNTPLFGLKGRISVAVCEVLLILFVAGSLHNGGGKRHIFFPIHNEPHQGIYARVLPFNLLHHTGYIIKLHKQINAAAEQLDQFSFGIIPCPDRPRQTIVLVIGETARYGNFGINGYNRNTTPRLQQRNNLISFDSVYSIANLTTVSVPFMLSPATPQTATDYMHQKSVVEAFAEAHYQTAWIANQSFGNQLLMRISETCNYTHYIPSDNSNHDNLDIHLLDYLRPLIDSAQCAQFVVLHSLGCHYKYNYRYPPENTYFLPDMNNRPDIEDVALNLKEVAKQRDNQLLFDEIRTILVNSYDNAIRYTDYFLDSTISLLNQSSEPCLLVYIGDHGENLLDDERHLLLHGTYGGSTYEYHVPMFVWYSDSYRAANPQKIACLHKHKESKTSSMSLFGTLLDLGSIDYPQFDRTHSLASDTFVPDSIVYGLDANMHLIKIPTNQP